VLSSKVLALTTLHEKEGQNVSEPEHPKANTGIAMKIDPALQAEITPLLAIARGTFAKDAAKETLTNTLLLTFAGNGLATIVRKQEDLSSLVTTGRPMALGQA
jgi:hypothetical protein